MPVAVKPSMGTLGSHCARPLHGRGVTIETYTFAKLTSERKGLRVGVHMGREQWNPAAIPTILTVGQRQPATTTHRRYVLADGAVFSSGPSARPGPRIIDCRGGNL